MNYKVFEKFKEDEKTLDESWEYFSFIENTMKTDISKSFGIYNNNNVFIGLFKMRFLKEEAYIESFEIAKRFRGLGLGKAFMKELLMKIKKEHQKCKIVVLGPSKSAMDFWMHLGFVELPNSSQSFGAPYGLYLK
jgi:GNAT superfamily N-acetyltransferase